MCVLSSPLLIYLFGLSYCLQPCILSEFAITNVGSVHANYTCNATSSIKRSIRPDSDLIVFGDSSLRQLYHCYKHLCNTTDDSARRDCYAYEALHRHFSYRCGNRTLHFRWCPQWTDILRDELFIRFATNRFDADVIVSSMWHYGSTERWKIDFHAFVLNTSCAANPRINLFFQYGVVSYIDWLAAIGYAKLRLATLNCSVFDATTVSFGLRSRMRDHHHFFGDATIEILRQTLYAK